MYWITFFVAEVMKIISGGDHSEGHEEFIELILQFFCFSNRLLFHCDFQKKESIVTRLKRKAFVTSDCVLWSLK